MRIRGEDWDQFVSVHRCILCATSANIVCILVLYGPMSAIPNNRIILKTGATGELPADIRRSAHGSAHTQME